MRSRVVAVFMLVLLLCSGTAFAKNDKSVVNGGGNGIVDIFMADFEGYDNTASFTPASSFHEDDAPWLYLKLKDSVTQVSGNWWFWNKGNQDALLTFDTLNLSSDIWDTRSSDNPDGTKNLWITRLDFDDYAAHDQWWHINNVHSNNPNGGGSAKYRVTPEPVSMLLFVLGGGAFALSRRRKA